MKESFFTEQQKREKELRAEARAKAGERQQKIVDRRRKWSDSANGIKEEPKKEEVTPFSDWHHEVDQRQRITKRRQALATEAIERKKADKIKEEIIELSQTIEKNGAESQTLDPVDHYSASTTPPKNPWSSFVKHDQPLEKKKEGWIKRNWTKLKETIKWGW